MTDSIKQFTSIEHIDATEEEINTLPFLVEQTINQDGEILSSTPKPQWIKSKLTGATFMVISVFSDNKFARKGELIGYLISINVPACVVGNNALLQILVYWCCVFAVEFLKSYLLDAGCSSAIVDQLDLKHCSVKEVALTYLLDCKDRAEANCYNSKIEHYGEATLNTKHTNSKQKKPIVTFSSAGQTTVTITKRSDFEAKSYVKDGPSPRSFETFHSPEVREAVYGESCHKVRLENNVDEKWLLANGGDSPLAWKNKAKAEEFIAKAFRQVTDYLRANENLRSKRPKPDQVAKLPPAEQAILLDYFNGVDPKQHPSMVGKSAQYFSSVKRHIQNELRIDITIPWAIHSTKISPDLPEWMKLPAEYEAPDHLMDHCFVRDTAKAKLKQLRQINAGLAAQHAGVPTTQSGKNAKTRKANSNAVTGSLPHRGDDSDNETSDISDLMG